MDIILQENYPSLGYVGDKVKVKGGYARNFLIPRGIAIEASSRNAKLLAHRIAGLGAKRAKLKGEASGIAKSLNEISLEFHLKSAESGKTFGSITGKDIAEELTKKGFTVEKRQIRILDSFKSAGDYKVEVKLHAEVSAQVGVRIISDRVQQAAKPEEKGKRRGGRSKAEVKAESKAGAAAAEVNEIETASAIDSEAEETPVKEGAKRRSKKTESDEEKSVATKPARRKPAEKKPAE